jgi:hypothetical protein
MGFEGKIYWDSTPGSTATTELQIVRDASYGLEPVEGDVSDRSSLLNLVDVAGLNFNIEFEINNKDSDAFISAARAAALAGNGLPLRTMDKASGYGVDGDFIIGLNESQPLRDAQRIRVTAKPTDKHGRLPTWS